MARAVNVMLEVNNKEYNINNMGLVSMTFDRYLGNTSDRTSNVLTNLDITMFDYTGYQLLSILQKERGKIKLKYGFEDDMSSTYILNSLKYNATYNNMGVMIAIGAYALQTNKKFPSEAYPPGVPVGDMLRTFAKRNGWYIGEEGSNEFISVGDMKTIEALYKTADEDDMSFITLKLLPQCNRVLLAGNANDVTEIWDVRLIMNGSRPEFYFRENNQRATTRRVYHYNYGVNTKSNVISLTNSVDMSFLVNGLTIQVPMTASDFLVTDDQLEEKKQEIRDILAEQTSYIERLISDYGLPSMSPSDFDWNIELIEAEDAKTSDPEVLRISILDKINKVMNAVNTIELQVIGNPKIMPTDLVSLDVRNRDGRINILSSASAVGGYWRVVGIREEIGMGGYSTTLKLVREVTTSSIRSGGNSPSITETTDIEEVT
jgi:hypothetical protein